MKVSIITATNNSAATIVDTLKSLEMQSYPDIEHIIIDGASTDKTLDFIRQHSTRVTTIISEPDQGIYDALNKGIAAATGDIVGFFAFRRSLCLYKCAAGYRGNISGG